MQYGLEYLIHSIPISKMKPKIAILLYFFLNNISRKTILLIETNLVGDIMVTWRFTIAKIVLDPNKSFDTPIVLVSYRD